MGKVTIKKIEAVGAKAGYGKGFAVLMGVLVFASVCLIHIEVSRAKAQDLADRAKVTVERIPSSEARKMGIDARNH